MKALAVFLGLLSLPTMADEVDWKLTLLEKIKDSVTLLERMEPRYFSKVERSDEAAVLETWEKHRSEMLGFMRKAKVKHKSQDNMNGECLEITDVDAGVIQASGPTCANLSERAIQRDIMRELFRVVGDSSDDHSRWGAFALEDGWNKNKKDFPPFPLVGKYHLTQVGGSHVIEVEISRLDANNQYQITVNTLYNGNGDKLFLQPLRMSSPARGGAAAKNVSSYSKSWRAEGIGIVARETGYGREAIEVTFTAPDKIDLSYTGKVTRWEWSENISSPSQAFVRARDFSSSYYKGTKQP